jgi:hypothetical protein
MTKHIEDDNAGQGQASWFAICDIEARAKAAYAAHEDFFNSEPHNARCYTAKRILKDHARIYEQAFVTEKQSKGQPYTLVKLNKVEFRPGMRVKMFAALEAAGFIEGEFGYRPASQSTYVKVK